MAHRKQHNTHDPRKSEQLFREHLKLAERHVANIDKLNKLPLTPQREAQIVNDTILAAYHAGKAEVHQEYAGMKQRNAYGWGAFLGSLAGAVLGSPLGVVGELAGSVGGGYLGGMHGLPSGRPSKKGAQWGAVGGVLGPIGAGLAARAATDSGRSPNPRAEAGHALPPAVPGPQRTIVVDGIGTILIKGNYAYRASYSPSGHLKQGGLIATHEHGKWTTYGLDARASMNLEAKLRGHPSRSRNLYK